MKDARAVFVARAEAESVVESVIASLSGQTCVEAGASVSSDATPRRNRIGNSIDVAYWSRSNVPIDRCKILWPRLTR